jgi:hypothetical protein
VDGIEPGDHIAADTNRPDPASGPHDRPHHHGIHASRHRQATRTAVTARITAHVKHGWPRLHTPLVRFRGQFCYVDAVLPGHREPTPILRLRYQGSTDRRNIGIYLASDERYTESELPTSFGPKTGTPEEGIDHTFILYAGPSTQH